MKRILWVVASVCVILFFIVFFLTEKKDVLSRVSIAVASSPTAIWSWDRESNVFTIFQIPSNYTIQGMYGYGEYSLESLWKLGFIDKKSGKLFSQSVQQAFAVTIPYFIGESAESMTAVSESIQYGKQLFSFQTIIRLLLGTIKTNIPLSTYIRFVIALQQARLDAFHVIDLSDKFVANSVQLPDGTTQEVLDTGRLDLLLKGVLEDDHLRQEHASVAVYNTTKTPLIGTYAARILSNLGILVVTVGNSDPELQTCELRGTKESLKTQTASALLQLFQCQENVHAALERADLEVYLGSAYAHQFSSGAL